LGRARRSAMSPRAGHAPAAYLVAALALGTGCGGSASTAAAGSAAGQPDGGSGVDGGTSAPRIASFSVGPDQALSYPDSPSDPPYLVDLPDEHTTFVPLDGGAFLVYGASKLSGGTGGAVVLETSDFKTFQYAKDLGYARQVMASPMPIDQCSATYATEFDENYAAPGSVVQDPTLPPGNLVMIYEAENHCPGGTVQQPFYATVGFARSSDGGKTWPAPANAALGNASRHPALVGPNPQPSVPHTPMGDAVPSAYVDQDAQGRSFLYVAYSYYDGGQAPATDHVVRVARAQLGADPLVFQKWYQGSFSQPGIGGLDSGVLPATGCPLGVQVMPEIGRNDDLGLYLMVFVCRSATSAGTVGTWYYSTATSLELEDWSVPQPIAGSQFPVTSPCPGLTSGGSFDGWYPSLVSPGAPSGHTKLTGRVFFQDGCDTGKRRFASRTFAIAPTP
jgi:hypothetical protein